MATVDELVEERTKQGLTPPKTAIAPPPPPPLVVPNTVDALVNERVQANPTVLDDVGALTPRQRLAASGRGPLPTRTPSYQGETAPQAVGDMAQRALTTGVEMVGSIFTKGPMIANLPQQVVADLAGGTTPEINKVGQASIAFGERIKNLAPMDEDEKENYRARHPNLEKVSDIVGQFGGWRTLGRKVGGFAAATLGAEEGEADVRATEQRLGVDVSEGDERTTEVHGALGGFSDVLAYEQGLAALWKKAPGVVGQIARRVEDLYRTVPAGVRLGGEHLSRIIKESVQEWAQQEQKNWTARDWVGYDPGRNPHEGAALAAESGAEAAVVYTILDALTSKHVRGTRTIEAEDAVVKATREAETLKAEQSTLDKDFKVASLARDASSFPPYTAKETAETISLLERDAANLEDDAGTMEEAKPILPDLAVFERQTNRAVEYFEGAEVVTGQMVNAFSNLPGVGGGEKQIANEVFNDIGQVSGKVFATAMQAQLFPLAAREMQTRSDVSITTYGVERLMGQTVPTRAWSWETPFIIPEQEARRPALNEETGTLTPVSSLQPAVSMHTFAVAGPRPSNGSPLNATRALLSRVGHHREIVGEAGVDTVVEIQTERVPANVSVLPEHTVDLGAPAELGTPQGKPAAESAKKWRKSIRQVSQGQSAVLKSDLQRNGLIYMLRNLVAKKASEGKARFRLVMPADVKLVQGNDNATIRGLYEDMHKWLKANFETRVVEVSLTRTSYTNTALLSQLPPRQFLEIDIPSAMASAQLPIGYGPNGALRQVSTPYATHERAVLDAVDALLTGNFKDAKIFQTKRLRDEAAMLRQRVKELKSDLAVAQVYEATAQRLKDLEFEIRARENAARRLTAILNWRSSGRTGAPPGAIGSTRTPPDRLERDNINWMYTGFGTLMDLTYSNQHIAPLRAIAQTLWFKQAYIGRQVHKAVETKRVLSRLPRAQRDLLFAAMVDNMIGSKELDSRLSDSFIVKDLQDRGAKPKTIEAYLRVRKDFGDAIDTLEDTLLSNLKTSFTRVGKFVGDAPTAEAKVDYDAKVAAVYEQMGSWRRTEYFPAFRFGKFKVKVTATADMERDGRGVKKGETLEYMQFESESDLVEAVRELTSIYEGRPASIQHGIKITSPFAISTGVPAGFLDKLQAELSLTGAQRNALFEMSAKIAPSKSFIQRFLKKRLVAGYSRDGIRSYAEYFLSFSTYVANLKFDHAVDYQLSELTKSLDKFKEGKVVDVSRRERIIEHVENHVKRLRANQSELTTIKQVGVFGFLGFSVKTVYVNLLQVPMILYPYLSARYEGGASAITNAYGGQVGNAILTAVRRVRKVQSRTTMNPDPGLDDILSFLYESGKLDQSFWTELASTTTEDHLQVISQGRARQLWHGTVAASMWPFQKAEELNRRVAVEATYRLEMDLRYPGKKWGDLAPKQRARVRETVIEMLDKTMLEYSRWNRAKFMQGQKSAIFLFYGYMQGILSFIATDPGKRKAILFMLIMGGLEGLPGFGTLLDLLDTLRSQAPDRFNELFGLNDEPADLRSDLREWVMDYVHGDTAARDLVMSGVGKRHGFLPLYPLKALGVDVPEVDISGSLGMGRIVPQTDTLRRAAVTGDGALAWQGVLEAFAGPVGQQASGMLEAMLTNDIDTWKRLERGMTTAGKALSKGIRRQERGGETSNITDVTTPTTTGENVAQGLNFSPTRVAQASATSWQVRERALWLTGRRRALLDQIEREIRDAGSRGVEFTAVSKATNDELGRFNERAPGKYKLTKTSISRALTDRMKSGAIESELGVPEIRDLELYEQMERLWGRPE